jgi:hypothetical protein
MTLRIIFRVPPLLSLPLVPPLITADTTMRLSILASCLATAGAFTSIHPAAKMTHLSASTDQQNEHDLGRRDLFRNLATSAGTAALALSPFTATVPVANAAGSALDDLPPEAQRSYKQYRIPLQVSADYYLWELRDKISRIDDWGEVNEVCV